MRRRSNQVTVRRIWSLAVVAVLLTAGPARSQWGLTPGGWVQGPIEHVRNVPTEGPGAISLELRGRHLYTTTWHSFSIYDVSDPIDPVLLSHTETGPSLFNEKPQTNGEILLISRDQVGVLEIWDVSDKEAPSLLSTYSDPGTNHIWECVLDCDYAYGARGTILDLSDPSSPRHAGDWASGRQVMFFHDIEEVEPGMVITGSVPMLQLDARKRPARPRLVRTIMPKTTMPSRQYIVVGPQGSSIPARVRWPGAARERFLLVSMETPFSGECTEDSGGFYTLDTNRRFRVADEYVISTNGTYSDGSSPYNVFGCSAYAIDDNPAFDRNRLVAVSWFEHGLRILRVDRRGQIKEIAGMMAHGTAAAEPVWLDEEIIYVADINRGLDIYRVHF